MGSKYSVGGFDNYRRGWRSIATMSDSKYRDYQETKRIKAAHQRKGVDKKAQKEWEDRLGREGLGDIDGA